ncbi:hypothetical protein [Mycolicibacterium sp. CBMA 234]|uniref:hypothetical protein n=1 Tax=Mycolicibacterium sp. CBMA 234 TaxID=1918495 RepID=UPI0012DEDF79|nr:hypothetical protein [Mycolicibacterium sp. CBMA 234]
MYSNNHFARATFSVVAGALIALGSLGLTCRTTEFTAHSCDMTVEANLLCQDGQHHHGKSESLGREHRHPGPRPGN